VRVQVRSELVANARAQEDENERGDLSLLPDMTVQFFHYYAKSMTELGYTADYWKRKWAEHFAKLERPVAKEQDAAAADANAAATQQAQQLSATAAAAAAAAPAPAASSNTPAAACLPLRDLTAEQLAIATSELKPPWLVTAFEKVHFFPSANSRSSRSEARQVAAATLLYWGPPDKVIAGQPYVRLREDVYKQVFAHLTGGREGPASKAKPRRDHEHVTSGAPCEAAAAKPKQQRKKKRPAVQTVPTPLVNGEHAAADAAAARCESPAQPLVGKKRRTAGAAAAVSASRPQKRRKKQRTPRCDTDEDESEESSADEEEEKDHYSEHSDTSSRRSDSGECSVDDNAPLSTLLSDSRRRAAARPASESDGDVGVIERIASHQVDNGVMWYLVKWDGYSLDDTRQSNDWFKRGDLPPEMADAYDTKHQIGTHAHRKRRRRR